MRLDASEWVVLNDQTSCSVQELADISGLSKEEIDDLIENGLVVPLDETVRPLAFSTRYVVMVRTARRLRDDFELDRHGVALAMSLMRRIEELEAEVRALSGASVMPPERPSRRY